MSGPARWPHAGAASAATPPGGGPNHQAVLKVAERDASQLGSSTCFVTDVAPNGSYVCGDMSGINILNAEGTLAWRVATPNVGYLVPMLAPDVKHVAATGPVILAQDGGTVAIGNQSSATSNQGFFCTGWLDGRTLIGLICSGATPQNQMAIVRLCAPSQSVPWDLQERWSASSRRLRV